MATNMDKNMPINRAASMPVSHKQSTPKARTGNPGAVPPKTQSTH
jgi:hypothetical protein